MVVQSVVVVEAAWTVVVAAAVAVDLNFSHWMPQLFELKMEIKPIVNA